MLLQIRILVETETEEGDLVRLEAFTLVVNAHGGLLEMSLKVPKGHRMSLSNPSLGVRAGCRAIASRSSEGESLLFRSNLIALLLNFGLSLSLR